MTLPPEVRQLAETVLTAKQFEAWELEAAGHSPREIMWRLNLHKSSVQDRLDAAHLNLMRAGVQMTDQGDYYLEETA